MPIGQSGAVSAKRPVTVSQSSASSSVIPSTVINPHWWLSSWATVATPLPSAANSGQYELTGAS